MEPRQKVKFTRTRCGQRDCRSRQTPTMQPQNRLQQCLLRATPPSTGACAPGQLCVAPPQRMCRCRCHGAPTPRHRTRPRRLHTAATRETPGRRQGAPGQHRTLEPLDPGHSMCSGDVPQRLPLSNANAGPTRNSSERLDRCWHANVVAPADAGHQQTHRRAAQKRANSCLWACPAEARQNRQRGAAPTTSRLCADARIYCHEISTNATAGHAHRPCGRCDRNLPACKRHLVQGVAAAIGARGALQPQIQSNAAARAFEGPGCGARFAPHADAASAHGCRRCCRRLACGQKKCPACAVRVHQKIQRCADGNRKLCYYPPPRAAVVKKHGPRWVPKPDAPSKRLGELHGMLNAELVHVPGVRDCTYHPRRNTGFYAHCAFKSLPD